MDRDLDTQHRCGPTRRAVLESEEDHEVRNERKGKMSVPNLAEKAAPSEREQGSRPSRQSRLQRDGLPRRRGLDLPEHMTSIQGEYVHADLAIAQGEARIFRDGMGRPWPLRL